MTVKETIRFGTDGVRGNTSHFPFTPPAVAQLGSAIAQWVRTHYKTQAKVLIGHDTRVSCWRLKASLKQSLMLHGIPFADAGIIPTPAVLHIMKYDPSFNAGIMISASHNPSCDNGIKLFKAGQGKISEQDEREIEANFENVARSEQHIEEETNAPAFNEAQSLHAQRYTEALIARFPGNFLAGKRIVLDCSHGATYQIAPIIFRALGADVTTIGTQPNGLNINEACGSLYPEELANAVLKQKAHFGFAFDGDGDRLICVDSEGIIKDGDDVLVHLLRHPLFERCKTIVGTLMTNHGLDMHISAAHKKLIRTSVGDKYVAAELEKNNLLLGGETSGHIIMRDYLNTGDGIFAALRVLEVMFCTKTWAFTPFKKYPQSLINVPVKQKHNLTLEPYKKIIDEYTGKARGRVIVRYSGTENVLRVMVEDSEQQSATGLAQALAYDLQSALDS
jgi:phosphoglucosamine mutase